MIAWLTDTFIYTTMLIALVLTLRRPVARHFGPQTAYALWALPLLRFAVPPIVLPASFAPASATALGTPIQTVRAAAVAETPHLPWVAIAFLAWVIGAALFLGWRCWSYFRMRDALLAGSRPVGEVGGVRLIETPALAGPVAFGVIDKVVALPLEFMALEDRAARDLAIEHELAHHRGRDLLANVLAQPLLALHWFNPLAWLGWRAMRRDQEAACDARVIARRGAAERAHYGRVIAGFAAGPGLALAAPLACPMASRLWGEKSIVHRLRSLNMSDISSRRRLAGRALWAAAALALPLTASVSYAVVPAPPAPTAPEAPVAPAAVAAPAALEAPPAPGEHKTVRHTYGGFKDTRKITTIVEHVPQGAAVMNLGTDADGKPQLLAFNLVGPPPAPMSEEQRRRLEAMSKQWADQGQRWAQWGKEWQKRAQQWAEQARTRATSAMQAGCAESPAVTDSARPGVRHFVLCRQYAPDGARRALERARASIANDGGLPAEARDEAIRSLDREIGRLGQDAATDD